jgi:hypothetical protein
MRIWNGICVYIRWYGDLDIRVHSMVVALGYLLLLF